MVRLVRAKLKTRETVDGLDFVRDEVPLGKVYLVDKDSLTAMSYGRTDNPGKRWSRLSVMVYENGWPMGWMPVELLEISWGRKKKAA